jgi:hypothetical protein
MLGVQLDVELGQLVIGCALFLHPSPFFFGALRLSTHIFKL